MVEASVSISAEDADCSKRRYHPKNILDKTCTNDEDFPDTWRDEYFSSTAEECWLHLLIMENYFLQDGGRLFFINLSVMMLVELSVNERD